MSLNQESIIKIYFRQFSVQRQQPCGKQVCGHEAEVRRERQPRDPRDSDRDRQAARPDGRPLHPDRDVRSPDGDRQDGPRLLQRVVSQRLRAGHHPQRSRGHGQRRPRHPPGLVFRGPLQHSCHTHQTGT